MTTPALAQEIIGWIGHNVIDRSGDKVGKVSQIYVDDKTGQPHWLAINTGLFGRRSSFVPTEGARTDGDNLAVPWSKSIIKDAPQVDDDGDGHLTIEEENELYSYYENRTKAGTDGKGGAEQRDKAMTRSQERVNVGTRTTETGRVRLRKYVVTEQVTKTVPVSHEEVRIEREPITDANRDPATSGRDISEDEHEVVLHAERPVVEKEVVPVERVGLKTETVSGEETINEEVRKEKIEEEGIDQAAKAKKRS